MKRVLAIETSCDDTSVAVVNSDFRVEALSSLSQDLEHLPYGGIVPEIACRNHTMHLLSLLDSILKKSDLKWDDIDGLAVTNRPGLIGSILVGLVTAKMLALTLKKPFVGVNHIEGHILAPFLVDADYQPPFNLKYPFMALAISGGHSHIFWAERECHYRLLGRTLDDAAGEAFDKFGKLVGLGFPGGVRVDQEAKKGDPKKYSFPIALHEEGNLDLSFSGVKSAALRMVSKMTEEELLRERPHLCASFQEAIVEALIMKLDRAAKKVKAREIVITGGVSANSRLRDRAAQWATSRGLRLAIPPVRFCTDNAAMIALAGLIRMNRKEFHDQTLGPSAEAWPTDFLMS